MSATNGNFGHALDNYV